MLAMMSTKARADELVVYGAGSLREAIGQIAAEFGQAHGIAVKAQFGPSGRMRQRIEAGEHVDLFASADVGHARKLVDDGRASVMTSDAPERLSNCRRGHSSSNKAPRNAAQLVRAGAHTMPPAMTAGW